MDKRLPEGLIDLHPQASNGDFHHIGVTVEIHVPNARDDLGAGEHFALALHEQVKQREFLAGQVDALVPAKRTMAKGMQLKIGQVQGITDHSRFAASEQRADAGEQLRKLERLGQIVVSAGVQSSDALAGSALAR
ncbi:hypothetical protein RirG_022230 [Rhizophagus irregularis DAOM 197198w]|uniref:Uncharacterized protein n=1 Tax=Rhizophagus irregularis (strain DAOM 197198w) TaxID=1432141 RepID=A0A015K7C6_RHIIW|nr:hypothetical protein RirG_022230 [Rhizophagus irregularis DAOM 197198w]